jgi:DNA-binding MarR family transcriptional regulator
MQAEDSVHFRLFNEIGIIAQLSSALFERVMPDGMTLAQFSVLNHFVRLGGVKSPRDLARAFQVTKATMTSTLQRLEAKGLVSVSPDPSDGRGKRVEITDAGRAMRERCIAALGPEIAKVELMLPQKQALDLLPALGQLRERLDKSRNLA